MRLDIKRFHEMKDCASVTIELKSGEPQDLHFSYAKVGYGFKRFFVCPVCGRECAILYIDCGCIKCRRCTNVKPYYGIQNTTKGGDRYIYYKMVRFAERNGIGNIKLPFHYWNYPTPKNKHTDKWLRNIAILQALENMRFQSIFLNKIWDMRAIQSVESGRNKCLKRPLIDLDTYCIQFDQGI